LSSSTGKTRPFATLSPLRGRRQSAARDTAGAARTRSGASVALLKPLRFGGLRKRPAVPYFWRSLSFSLAGSGQVPEGRLNDWILVLTAKKISHRYFPSGRFPRLYVPPMQEGAALHEIRAFEAERPLPIFMPPARDNIGGVLFFLLMLLCWHALRWNWFGITLPSPPFPGNAQAWASAFGMDMYRFRTLHELWRAITALTLHADDAHLFSNLGFGLLFLIPLCRRAGLGLGIALTLLAGIFGNACNSLFKEANVISIGFSTALFGAVGALCALTAADIFRHMRRFAHLPQAAGVSLSSLARRLFLPVAAGLALLGLLGGGGEAKTDYSAHILGFFCGVVTTLAALPLESRIFALAPIRQQRVQASLLLGAFSLLASAWVYALWLR